MPRNGLGTYTLPAGNPVVTGTTISSTVQNNTMSDVATAITQSIARDGQTTPTANLPMGGFNHTNVANAVLRNQYAALGQVQDGGFNYIISASGTDTYAGGLPFSLSAYSAGQAFYFPIPNTNTGPSTLNINGSGVKSIVKKGNVPLTAGELFAGEIALLVYDGTNFQLMATTGFNSLTSALNTARASVAASATTSDIWGAAGNQIAFTGAATVTDFPDAPQAGATRFLYPDAGIILTNNANIAVQGGNTLTADAGDVWRVTAVTVSTFIVTVAKANGLAISSLPPRAYISGLNMSTAGSSATMSISVGQCADSTNAVLMSLAASINKTTSAWAVGSGNGGLDTGSIANNTTYHFYLIRRPDTGVVDVVFSTNASAPTLPTNYTQYRRIFSDRTNGSAQWVRVYQRGNEFWLDAPVLDVDINNEPTAAVLRTLSIPSGIKVKAMMDIGQNTSGVGTYYYVSDPDLPDLAPSFTAAPLGSGGTAVSSTLSAAQVSCWSNTSSQIRTRHITGSVSNSFRIATLGWVDLRGTE